MGAESKKRNQTITQKQEENIQPSFMTDESKTEG